MSGVGGIPRSPKHFARRSRGPLRFVLDRVGYANGGERFLALATRDAGSAMHGAVPIARPGDVERDVYIEAHSDDLLLRPAAQRDQDLHGRLFVGPQAEVEHAVEEVEEFRARVGERFGVDAVVTAHQVARRVEFRVVAREAVEDQVPARDVPLRGVEEDAVLETLLPKVVDLFQEGKVHVPDGRGPGLYGERANRRVLLFRPAEVVERERSDVCDLVLRPRARDGRHYDGCREANRT